MTKTNKKILVVIPKLFHGGGAEKVSVEIGKLLKEQGNQVSYFTFHGGDDMPGEYSLKYSENKLAKLYRMFTLPFTLARYCKKNDIDTIISHTERANYISIASKLITKSIIQVITVTHNYKYIDQWKNYLPIFILYRYADCNVTVSRAIEQSLRKKYSLTNTQTIYNPFDFEKIDKLAGEEVEDQDKHLFTNDKTTFINIGRLHEQKGQTYLIDAFAMYHRENPNSQLVILGEGSLRNQLQEQINKAGMQKHIHLLGNRANVFPYLKASDCFVLSSLWEGLPTVLIEAMGVGVPIISTNCKSGPDEILPESDRLVDVNRDMVTNLVQAMLVAPDDLVEKYETTRFSRLAVKKKWDDLVA